MKTSNLSRKCLTAMLLSIGSVLGLEAFSYSSAAKPSLIQKGANQQAQNGEGLRLLLSSSHTQEQE
jgi:hypothetical protein